MSGHGRPGNWSYHCSLYVRVAHWLCAHPFPAQRGLIAADIRIADPSGNRELVGSRTEQGQNGNVENIVESGPCGFFNGRLND